MKASGFVALALALGAAAAGCKPTLEDDTSRVEGVRVLAIRAEPAEAKPNDPATLTALVVDEDGPRDGASVAVDWAYCLDRKPLSELGPVSRTCLAAASPGLVPLASTEDRRVAQGVLPTDGCRLFGPERPDPKPGEPAGRPVDPDTTGGFYQPVRLRSLEGEGEYSIFWIRLACGAAGVTQAQTAELERRYRANVNPVLDALVRVDAGGEQALDPAAPIAVRAGESVTLRASWPDCGAAEASCAGAEAYAYYDPATRAIRTRREAMRVAWFATAGAFAEGRTGLSEEESGTARATENRWTAPSAAGTAHVWIVVRDDRGGVGWREYRVEIGS